MTDLSLTALPVLCGDSLILEYGVNNSLEKRRIVVDTGYAKTYHSTLKPYLTSVVEQGASLDLLVLTHVDDDHIRGVFPLLKDFTHTIAHQYWLNYSPNPLIDADESGKIGMRQGIDARDLLMPTGKLNREPVMASQEYMIGNGKLTILSPDKAQFDTFIDEWKEYERNLPPKDTSSSRKRSDHKKTLEELCTFGFHPDKSPTNRSSIAFLLEVDTYKILLLSDSFPDVVADTLEKKGFSEANLLKADLVKVSHHGSRKNTNNRLLDLIDCHKYLISTHYENTDHFPHKETLARIIYTVRKRDVVNPIHFYFTYDDPGFRTLFSDDELKKYLIKCHFPCNPSQGIKVTFPENDSF
ncbi:MBL fold metallo-hydrolase [Spirosoma sp. HMF3257]|uniref:Metallo-beta-lactamase domain-containing protein n=1 Tax=Spirosoma telluris TaxID=2183553 RepID=A0A327NDV9_9BACT|nr:MBL fold metallo-hydrolase [Spirosoma telluris]RAI72893.1 hypothetical protein HMF3257_38990 [Spirosoma telluris]